MSFDWQMIIFVFIAYTIGGISAFILIILGKSMSINNLIDENEKLSKRIEELELQISMKHEK